MQIFNGNGKVIFDGAFNASKIDFNDEEAELGEDFMLPYNDKNLMTSDMITALFDFMSTEKGWFGNDDDETRFYLFCGCDGEPCLSAQCKPYLYDFESSNKSSQKLLQKMYDKSTDEKEKAWIKRMIIQDKKESKKGSQAQQAELEDLQNFSDGYEVTTFDVELTDSERQQLEKIVKSMLVKVVE